MQVDKILEAISQAEQGAREVMGMDEALSFANTCTCGTGGIGPYGHEPGCGYEPGLIWYMAEDVLRNATEDRDVLERHANEGYPGFGPEECGWCSEDTGYHVIRVLWPCPEVKSVMRRHKIQVDGD